MVVMIYVLYVFEKMKEYVRPSHKINYMERNNQLNVGRNEYGNRQYYGY